MNVLQPTEFTSLGSRAVEQSERKAKGQAASHFVDGMTIGQRMAVAEIESELVIDLPDQATGPEMY